MENIKNMKKLGFGLMRLPLLNYEDKGSIDVEKVKQMVDTFMEAGFTYFDTAYPYHNGMSERVFKETVSMRYPRESFTVTDKMPMFFKPESWQKMQEIFDEQLDRCGVEYFDYYLLHALGKDTFDYSEKVDAFGFIKKMKEEGKIKHLGFSFHDSAIVLEEILSKHPEIEYVQLQINYLDWDSKNVQGRECYELCVKYGKPVIVMEPIKGGSLAQVPEEADKLFKEANENASVASWAVRYAASLDNVAMVLSGMSDMEQLLDNISYMKELKTLNDSEYQIINKVLDIIRNTIAIPCTKCNYCTEGCPMNIAIPDVFAVYNNLKKFPATKQGLTEQYVGITEQHSKASECVQCKQCEEHCPQHIEITNWLGEIAKTFE